MRLGSCTRLAFAECTDCIDICLCQNMLRNEMREVLRWLVRAGGQIGLRVACCRTGRGLTE